MKVFVAGGTGAVGRRLLPQLVTHGHEVVATTRSREKVHVIEKLGAKPVVMDGLDAGAVTKAIRDAAPDVVIHELTALARPGNFKNFDKEFALTNELRTAGTDNLLRAARAAGVKRFAAQSYTGWPNPKSGSRLFTEGDGFDPDPPKKQRRTLAAIRYLEEAALAAADLNGIVLRYGSLYGPGTSLWDAGEHAELVRKRRFPIVGDGGGVWSMLHIDDAAAATVVAAETAVRGVFNIADDLPAPVSEWLPYLAECLGAPPPRRMPVWLARPLIGEVGISMMTQIRGSSNERAKKELGWRPIFASWRDGFRYGLGPDGAFAPSNEAALASRAVPTAVAHRQRPCARRSPSG